MGEQAHLDAEVTQVAATYGLTRREQQAVLGICSGLTNRELAVRMNISPNTVKAFVHVIMLKMGVETRAAITAKLQRERDRARRPDETMRVTASQQKRRQN